eukprot:scaffold5501_cov142-Skeletonema_marinoi.AAC.5
MARFDPDQYCQRATLEHDRIEIHKPDDSIYDTFNAWNGSGGFLQQVHRGRVVTEILSELEVEQVQVRLGLMGELTADM